MNRHGDPRPTSEPLVAASGAGCTGLDGLIGPIALTLVAGMLVWSGCRVMVLDKMFPDFICYWTAAQLVWSGDSPYDTRRQAEVQQALGWKQAAEGFGQVGVEHDRLSESGWQGPRERNPPPWPGSRPPFKRPPR